MIEQLEFLLNQKRHLREAEMKGFYSCHDLLNKADNDLKRFMYKHQDELFKLSQETKNRLQITV